jgi:hypothetical protein
MKAGAWMVALLLAAWPLQAADFGPAELFQILAAGRHERAEFREKKFMALLDRPVESSGVLSFTPPDKLEKRTLLPKPETLTADREQVTLERGGKRHTLRLRENPQVAVVVESLRATLAGDLAALTRTYSVGLEGARERWRLVLRPLDPALEGIVTRIAVGGEQGRVGSVEIFQADGDRSVMTITPAK